MPDRLSEDHTATDRTAELEREQTYLGQLYQRLDGMREYAQRRLRTVLLEAGGTPQARSERESFTQLYSEDLAKYDAAENGLCFGRIDLVRNRWTPRARARPALHRPRLGILDEKNDYETLLLDWRAPLARPFYLATTGHPRRGDPAAVTSATRNRSVTGDQPTNILDLDTARSGGRDRCRGGAGSESALLSALNAARTGQMNDIVETIQSEQDAIIRSEHRSVLVVQGGPGTARRRWPCTAPPICSTPTASSSKRAGVLIIGPNATFLDYIGQVLPSLGETGVLLSTIGNLYPGVRATRGGFARAAERQGLTSMIEIFKKAVRDRQEVPRDPMRLEVRRLRAVTWTARSSPARAGGPARRDGRTIWPGRCSRPRWSMP